VTADALPPDLAAAIEHAYEVFAGYRFANTVGCACCNDDDVRELSHRRLTETPLRELSVGDVDYVCSELLTMWGDQADAKVLAPRVLELVSASVLLDQTLGTPSPLPSLVLSDTWTLSLFVQSDWRGWPARERDAVGTCLRRLWTHLLAKQLGADAGDPDDGAESLVDLLSLVDDPRPYLDGFLVGPAQARRLAWFIRSLADDEDPGLFGVRDEEEGSEAQRAVVEAWVRSEAVRDALVRAVRDPASDGFRWELVVGLEQLGRSTPVSLGERRYGRWVPDVGTFNLAKELGVELDRDR
jgi:hypothetical protein